MDSKVKAKIKNLQYRPYITSEMTHYCLIIFKDSALCENKLSTEDYKTKRGALSAAKRICEKFKIQFEVVK